MSRAVFAAALAVIGCSRAREPEPEPEPPAPELPGCAVAPAGPFEGEATRYAADGSGSCSFDASSADRRVAAMNAVEYRRAAWCGACVEVTGPRGLVIVRIVDRCPACKAGDLDLSREAFSEIAPVEVGRVAISWRPVPCEVQGPLSYRFKSGSSAFWAAIQLRDHRYAIETLEARDRTGAWSSLTRADYNYFVSSDLGPGPLSLRVTDVRGHVLEEPAVPIGDATTHAGSSQLELCRGDEAFASPPWSPAPTPASSPPTPPVPSAPR